MYLVVLFHAGLPLFAGGFIGVDVFFVLSGFLVTGLLVHEFTDTGRIGLAAFYARRVRRLLPAAVVVLLVVAVAFSVVSTPAARLDVQDDFRSALVYVANWNFIAQANDYFAADLDASPVLHFWSLSVEEQFYVAWPVALLALIALARRIKGNPWLATLRVAVLAGLVLGVLHSFAVAAGDVSRAYYGTDTRVYQLLAGAALALVPLSRPDDQRIRRGFGAVTAMGLVTLVVLATDLVDLPVAARGALATLVAVQVIVGLEMGAGSTTAAMLSVRPVTYLGRISYGTYLWHWPLVVLLGSTVAPAPVPLLMVVGLGATALAALSHRLLEMPVRLATWRPARPTVAVGLATSVLVAVVAVPVLLSDRRDALVIASTPSAATPADLRSGATPVPPEVDWQAARDDAEAVPQCLEGDTESCTLVTGTGPHLHLVGDSHARSLAPAMVEAARSIGAHLTVSVLEGCSWPSGITLAGTQEREQRCQEHQASRVGTLDRLAPDIVVVVGRSLQDLTIRHVDGGQVEPGTPDHESLVGERMAAFVEAIRRPGRTIVLVEPVPEAVAEPVQVPDCLSGASHLEECLIVARDGPSTYVQHLRDLAYARDDVEVIDLSRAICPRYPVCDPVVDGIVTRIDDNHLTRTFARHIAPALVNALRGAGTVE